MPPLASRTEHQKRRFVKIWGVVKPIYGSIYLPLSRLATADLMVMRKDIGLGGEMLKDGDDFALVDEVTK